MEPGSWKSRSRRAVSTRWRRATVGALGIAALWLPTALLAQTPTAAPKSGLETTPVAIAGRIFQLEFARSAREQQRGLGGRSHIQPYGGMLFAYSSEGRRAMVMRDCPIPIDVAFLSEKGRVVAIHEMRPEVPRGARESDSHYEARLPSYESGKPAQFAVELAGGRFGQLGVRVGDALVADWPALAARAR